MKAGDNKEIEVEITNEEDSITTDKVTYWVNPHHRDKRPDKSQWTIIPDEELKCFTSSWQSRWYKRSVIDGEVMASHLDESFGLYLIDNVPHTLGIRKRKAIQEGKDKAELLIARFIPDEAHKKWHGYPADGELNDQDIPSDFYLKEWKKSNYFKPAQISKIKRGRSL